jgi:hypothetical protein
MVKLSEEEETFSNFKEQALALRNGSKYYLR